MNIEAAVQSALVNAAENDYSFEGWSAEDIALDMLAYDFDLEDADLAEVTAAVAKLTGRTTAS